jgi:hypothetical protein
MKLAKSLLTILLLLFVVQSCKKEASKTVALAKNYTQLQKANWFIGTWENATNEMTMKEIWKQETDSSFSADSFIIVQKDTVFYEKVDLIQRNDSLFYIVSVKNQNNEKPVSFYLTTTNESELVFENQKHDFPNKITYYKITNDSLVATISGLKDGKMSSETFPMKKINNND